MEVKLESRFKLNANTINIECPVISAEGCMMAIINLHDIICEYLEEINDKEMEKLYDIENYLRYIVEAQPFISNEAQKHKEEREIYIKEVIKDDEQEEMEYRDIQYEGDIFLCDIMVVTNCILYLMTNGDLEILESIIDTLKMYEKDTLLN